jgi:hypothetical protein
MTAFEVLRCDLSLVYKYFPTWIQGMQVQNGRTILVIKCRDFTCVNTLNRPGNEKFWSLVIR